MSMEKSESRMKKILRGMLVLTVSVVATSAAFADHHFCCSDTNWQQDTLDKFYDPQNHQTNFSFPSGIFRKACTNCEYDMNTLSCYCEDIAGLVSIYPTRLKIEDCQNIFSDQNGVLHCGD